MNRPKSGRFSKRPYGESVPNDYFETVSERHPYATNLSGGHFESVPACPPLHVLGATKGGPIQQGIKTEKSLVGTIWGDCVKMLHSNEVAIGLFINERKEFLKFRHLEKELVGGIFQLFGE
ncbi:MAG: hypothetical protein ACLP5H_00210 [Desulfomonilaceae bacterium]